MIRIVVTDKNLRQNGDHFPHLEQNSEKYTPSFPVIKNERYIDH